jgi:hypothetical protein
LQRGAVGFGFLVAGAASRGWRSGMCDAGHNFTSLLIVAKLLKNWIRQSIFFTIIEKTFAHTVILSLIAFFKRASPRVCQILLGKPCLLPTSEMIRQVKK